MLIFAYFAYFLTTVYFYLFDVYDPLISIISTFLTFLSKLKGFERTFFKKERPEILYFVRKYQIAKEFFHNFIYTKSLISSKKAFISSKKAFIFRFLTTYLAYLFFTALVITVSGGTSGKGCPKPRNRIDGPNNQKGKINRIDDTIDM